MIWYGTAVDVYDQSKREGDHDGWQRLGQRSNRCIWSINRFQSALFLCIDEVMVDDSHDKRTNHMHCSSTSQSTLSLYHRWNYGYGDNNKSIFSNGELRYSLVCLTEPYRFENKLGRDGLDHTDVWK